MSFLVKDSNCLKNIIISGIKSVNSKYLKTEIKPYKGKINTFQDGMLKEGSHCICLSVTIVDSVFKIDKNYYPWVFLQEC